MIGLGIGAAGELVGLYSHDPAVPDWYRAFSYPNYVDIRERAGVFGGLMAHTFAMVGEPPLAAFISYAFTKVFVEIGGFDPMVVGVSTVLLALAATVAGAVPARRAARIAPLTALRTE